MLCFYRGSLNTEVTDRKDKVINTLLEKLEKKNHEEIPPSRATANGSSVIQGTSVDVGLVNELLFIEVKMLFMNLLKEFLKSINIANKKKFIKNLIISEEEHLFQESNSCLIGGELLENDDEKVGDYCHITGKFRGASHWDLT